MFILACLSCFMPLEEKVGQLLMTHFRGEIANDDAKTLIQDVGVGGIIYYTWANELRSPAQVHALSKSLQDLAKTTLDGYHKAGVITTLKHFPGHGDVAIDSHTDLPIVYKSIEELEAAELLPFTRLANDTEAIMTAHILIPAMDTENCATLSK